MTTRDPNVDHPDHYGGEGNPYEAIKVIEAWRLGFCLGNAIKYISRAGKKDPAKELQDIKKATWYVARRILELEQEHRWERFLRRLAARLLPTPGPTYHSDTVVRAWQLDRYRATAVNFILRPYHTIDDLAVAHRELVHLKDILSANAPAEPKK